MVIISVIVAEDLVKTFGEFVAVDGISFMVEEGEVFGFLGPNGAGKTTAMKMIQCVSPKTSGKLEVFGMDVNTHQSEIKRFLGIVPQETNLDPDFSVYENMMVYSRYFDIGRTDARKVTDELLDFVQLDEKKNVNIEQLSGGMKRRLILARALINSPRLLILDEPTVGLDPQARHLIWDKLRSLRDKNVTIVLTTHYLDEAAQLCNKLVIMDHGRILEEGSPQEIVKNNIGTDIVEVENGPEVKVCLDDMTADYEIIGDIVQVYTDDPQQVTSHLLRECMLGKITARTATLEDVFLKLTGRKLRE
ncbi:MAG: ATP-binding cassette domain-containing protein [ANME-2 cluster archaeon]|nr:ATP-binding cassette domain-containing protein [ANME-2 cluster archaeon]